MAVPKNNGKIPSPEHVNRAALASIEQLLNDHMKGALSLLEESEGGVVTLRVPITVDCTESQPQVTVGIGYTKSVRDKRVQQLEDPDQSEFGFHEVKGKTSEAQVDEGDEDGTQPVESRTTSVETPQEEKQKPKRKRAAKKK